MGLFKNKKKLSVPQLNVLKLSSTPKEQLFSLQKRFDHLQDIGIQLTTHIGELKLNADGEIKRIELLMERIKAEMKKINTRAENIEFNSQFLVRDLNLTARESEIEKFKQDLERIKPHNYITVTQFEKMLKDYIN